MDLDATLKEELDQLVSTHPVVLFMKGDRQQPRCGFSARVVGTLDVMLDRYATVDVLAREEVREGIKAYSDWPTIPQLYVNGEFVGGCDIVEEMFASGELAEVLGLELPAGDPPEVTVTAAAAQEMRAALPEADSAVRLTVTTDHRSDLSVGQRRQGDVVIDTEGLTLLLDPFSAQRADGLVIDFVREGFRSGFTLQNRRQATVRDLEPIELKAWMDEGRPFSLVDVRPAEERAVAEIPGALDMNGGMAELLSALAKDTPVVLYCHSGFRSQAVAARFCAAGFSQVYNLRGGVDAWSTTVDGSVPRY